MVSRSEEEREVNHKSILFLDFDGVLNHDGTFQTFRQRGLRHPLEPHLMRAVSDVVETTDSRIVLSTAWRNLYALPTLKIALASGGIDPVRIIDKTPVGPTRGQEIHAWLRTNIKTARIAILDDQDQYYFDMDPMRGWFVQTNELHGVTERHLRRVEHLLTNGPHWRSDYRRKKAA